MAEFPNHFENIEEAEFRLRNTIVTYDGQPAYIHKVRGDMPDGVFRVYISILPNNLEQPLPEDREDDPEDGVPLGRILRKKINSPKFNRFRPFKMGYANVFDEELKHPMLLSRLPVRKSTQGLCSSALAQAIPTMDKAIARNYARHFNTVVAAEGFAEMVRGEYPSMEEVLDTVEEGSAIAFDRENTIRRDELGLDFLYHGPQKVGLLRRGEVLLGQKFAYLQEKLRATPAIRANIGLM